MNKSQLYLYFTMHMSTCKQNWWKYVWYNWISLNCCNNRVIRCDDIQHPVRTQNNAELT